MFSKLQKALSNKRGFTLIELIVVIAIIAILVGLATPKFLGYTKDANVSAMQADSKTLSNGALQYAIKHDDNLPVGSVVDVTLKVDLVEIANATAEAVKSGETVDPATDFKELDQTGMSNFYKTLKNPLTEYVIVDNVNSVLHGEVFFVGKAINVEGSLVDSSGNINSGIYTVAK